MLAVAVQTFAINRAGIAQAPNKLTVRALRVGVPRTIVGQAVLDAGLLDEALQMLTDARAERGFTHTIGNRTPSWPAQRPSPPAPEHVGVTMRN